MNTPRPRPQLGIQGPVVAFEDPWAGARSDAIMRTGTGVTIASQDPASTPEAYVRALQDLGADFYVHHVFPTEEDHAPLIADLDAAGIDLVLGNEYGNINGPFVDGTNRYDIPASLIAETAAAGRLRAVLYDEPEHLQIHASQYRKDAHRPHFGSTTSTDPEDALEVITRTVSELTESISQAASAPANAPTTVLAEHVFPVLFHALAKAGMTPCPKVMKETFQPLQLATALGAAIQYGREFWICADLWGPDIGPWFTRAPGLPGHSPIEYASALRMAYLFAPTALFTENVDMLLQAQPGGEFEATEYGQVWREFVRSFVPSQPLDWSYADADPDIVLIHAEDSTFGPGRAPFGNRDTTAPESATSIFEAWHLLSHGTMPAHGSCLHIAGFDSPRAQLNVVPRSEYPLASASAEQTRVHRLFYPSRNTLVFDETVRDDQLGSPELIMVVGSRLPRETLAVVRARAEAGATVVITAGLTSPEWAASERFDSGAWVVTHDLLNDPEVARTIAPLIGSSEEWTQRFGDTEIRMTPNDAHGETLRFEVRRGGGAPNTRWEQL